jgi:hypothetical protein
VNGGKMLCTPALRLFGVALAALCAMDVAFAQDAPTAAWQARLCGKNGPAGVGGRFFKRNGKLVWSSGATSSQYAGNIAYVGDVVPFEPDGALIVGLTASLQGAIDLVRVEAQKLVFVATGSVEPIAPIAAVFDRSSGKLLLLDHSRHEVVAADWRAGMTLPTQWEKVVDAERLPSLRLPGTTITENPAGGILVVAHLSIGGTSVQWRNGAWSVAAPSGPEAGRAAALSVETPVRSRGPLLVQSSVAGAAVLECLLRGDRIELGRVQAGPFEIPLPAGVELDTGERYRVLVEPGTDPAIAGEWFRPRSFSGRGYGFGVLRLSRFDVAAEECYLGSVRFGSSLHIDCASSSGELELVSWFVIASDEKTVRVEQIGPLSFLDAETVLVQRVPLRTEKSAYDVAAPYAIPGDGVFAGHRVYAQAAVLGPGDRDLAITEICSVAVRSRAEGYPAEATLGKALAELWQRQGSPAPRYRQELKSRIATLAGLR